MDESVRLAVSEDDPVFADLLHRLLSPHFEVVGHASDAAETLELAAEQAPDVLLLDLVLRGENALELLPRLLRAAPRTMVAAMTGLDALEWEPRLLRAGAFVYYEKTLLQELPGLVLDDLTLFRRALAGEDVVAPSALRRRNRIDTGTLRRVVDTPSEVDPRRSPPFGMPPSSGPTPESPSAGDTPA